MLFSCLHRSLTSPPQYIQRYLHNLGPNWMVTRDTFSKKTPVGRVKFINIIATYVPTRTVCDVAAGGTRNVTAPPRIVLACHYDSIKLNDRGEHIFTGAIDAGVSCASILYLAKFATPYLTRAETFPLDHGAPARPTLQLVFFDGEEPVAAAAAGGAEFKAKDDSLYGSKHLVKMWSQNSAPYTDWFDRSSVTRLGSKRMRNNIQQLSERCLATDADDDDDNEMDNEVGGEEEGEAEDKKSVSAEDDNNVLDNEVVVDDNVELIKLTLARAQRRRRRVQGTLRNKGQKSGAQAGEREMIARQVRRLYSTLDSIQLLILLDLIGGKNPKFYNTTNQGRHFFRLAKIGKSGGGFKFIISSHFLSLLICRAKSDQDTGQQQQQQQEVDSEESGHRVANDNEVIIISHHHHHFTTANVFPAFASLRAQLRARRSSSLLGAQCARPASHSASLPEGLAPTDRQPRQSQLPGHPTCRAHSASLPARGFWVQGEVKITSKIGRQPLVQHHDLVTSKWSSSLFIVILCLSCLLAINMFAQPCKV